MEYITIGKKYGEGKVAFVKYLKNPPLSDIDIKDKSFLLIILKKGRLEFKLGNKRISAIAPAFICFDETENPVLSLKLKAEYTCLFFHPRFLNINMSFELLRSEEYTDIATTHDMFMLKPFIDKAYVIPILESQIENILNSADYMGYELDVQRDWYWSCRGRSYFMEVIIALERMYGLIGYGQTKEKPDSYFKIENPKLHDAVLYIESNYSENINLAHIAANAGLNHTTLTKLMKDELGCTATQYLMQYRVKVAKKQLAFTEVPIKDIVNMSGFKTVQHFGRIFKEQTGLTPAEYRKRAVQRRKETIK
jgi:AraC-like DNA-binding protein